ncbi:MAG: hypothetical protein LBB21_05110 [Holosporaceae bacterium]|jgi:hypothetical protein|nr:hypothetical protein [Holosporaceae bacterium]
MKSICCFCLALCAFYAFSEEVSDKYSEKPKVVKPSEDSTKVEPKIYVDISKSAQEEAVSFDGVRGLLGICFSSSEFSSSVGDSTNFTSISSSLLDIYLGLEYSRSFKKGFLLAIDVGTDISKKGKNEGNWATFNKEYEAQRGAFNLGNRTAKFEKSLMCPGVALKCGYLIRSLESMLFLKLMVSRLNGVYTYNSNDKKVCKVEANVYIPSVGIGFERKINKKWGASMEVNLSFKREIKLIGDEVEHDVKASRKDIKLMATYSISSK